MKIHEVVFDENQIVRKMPKKWKDLRLNGCCRNVQGEFGRYCKLLFESLVAIKHYYADFFNANNSWTIDEYISIFERLYNKILGVMFDKKKVKDALKIETKILGSKEVRNYKRFGMFEEVQLFNQKIYLHNSKGKIIGFTDDGYKKVSFFAKKMFMLEKMCAFTTRKIWQNEITKFEDLNFKKDFKIIVKAVFANGWRHQPLTKLLKDYYEDRIYSSASLIDNKTKDKVFKSISSYNCEDNMALLVMDYDDNCFVCANKWDAYSEETIDGKNPIKLKSIYSDIFAQSKDVVDGKIHKLYADAVETLTPKFILDNVDTFSEVNLKNAKPKAVIAPNKHSEEYSKKLAEDLGVPFIKSKNFVE